MRRVTQFADGRFCEGTANLNGCLGVPLVHVATPDMMQTAPLDFLCETPRQIVMHYLTEPPKINFVAVTSFLDGGVLGLDVFPSDTPASQPDRFEVIGDVAPLGSGRSVLVRDASPIAFEAKRFLRQFPLRPGSLVFEAHQELYVSAAEVARIYGRKSVVPRVYALLAICQSKDRDQNYLLMEDRGYVLKGISDRDIMMALARSAISCEVAENRWGDEETEYETIYIVGGFFDVPIGSHIQVQMIYCKPPRQSVD